MKSQALATLLLAIFAISSLKSVWPYEGFDFEHVTGGDQIARGEDVDELDEEAAGIVQAKELVNEFDEDEDDDEDEFDDELDEADLLNASDDSSKENDKDKDKEKDKVKDEKKDEEKDKNKDKKEKHKHGCREKSNLYVEAKCVKATCKHSCQIEGSKSGKCRKSKGDDVKKCYCRKQDCKKEDHRADAPPQTPTTPASPPFHPTPGTPADAPKQAPSTPADAPFHLIIPGTPADAPKQAPSTPADAPIRLIIPGTPPKHTPSTHPDPPAHLTPGGSADAPKHAPSTPSDDLVPGSPADAPDSSGSTGESPFGKRSREADTLAVEGNFETFF